jgi:hypothetical protein
MKLSLFFVCAFALSLTACKKDDAAPAVTNFATGFVGAYGNTTADGGRVSDIIIITSTNINEIIIRFSSGVFYGKTTSSTAFEIVAGTLTSSTYKLSGGGGVLTGKSLDFIVRYFVVLNNGTNQNETSTLHAVRQ